jgi:uroporphyrinogen-III synthase
MTSSDSSRAAPLAGLRIVVTRAESPSDKLSVQLRAAGAEVIEYPTIAFVPPHDTGPLDAALHAAAERGFDWLLLTSATGVRFVAARLAALAIDPAKLGALRVGAVGPATARAVEEQLGLPNALIPDSFVAEALAAALGDVAGAKILICAADLARPTLAEQLVAAGAQVTRATAYRTVPASGGPDLAALLAQGRVDAITFGSGSAARSFVQRIGPELLPAANATRIACIGPISAEAARAAGLRVDLVAKVSTIEGLVACLVQAYEARPKAKEHRP